MFITKKKMEAELAKAKSSFAEEIAIKNELIENKTEQIEILNELVTIQNKTKETPKKDLAAIRIGIVNLMRALEEPLEDRVIPLLYYEDDDTSRTVYTGFCQIGGCSLGPVKLPCKSDAYVFATLYLLLNGKPFSGLCPDCRQEYNESVM